MWNPYCTVKLIVATQTHLKRGVLALIPTPAHHQQALGHQTEASLTVLPQILSKICRSILVWTQHVAHKDVYVFARRKDWRQSV